MLSELPPTLNGVEFPSNWKILEIQELCDFIVDCLHSTPKVDDYYSGYYMVRTSDVGNGRINLDSARYVSKEVYEERIRRGTPQKHDIIITREAPMGNIGQILTEDKISLGQRMIHYRPNSKMVEPRYLVFALLSPAVQHEFQANRGTGSVVDNLLMGTARSLPIPLPPLPEQRRIAHILGTLDDKIELNRRTNQTLESIARAIFKSWFVDFDPVRAKMDGRPTGLPEHITGLFPDSFQDSELGKIPSGWRVEHLSNIANVVDCLHAKKPEIQNEGPLLLQVYNIGQSGEIDLSKTYPVTQGKYNYWIRRFEAVPGDLIISKTGRVGAIAQIPRGFKAALGRNLVGIRAIPEFILPGFLRDYMFSGAMKKEIARKTSQGTILNSLHVKNISIFEILLPPITLVEKYEQIIKPLHYLIEENYEESRNLAEIRDTLLPRLMRGELRV